MPANLHIQEEEDQRVDPENQGARNTVKEDTVRVLSKIVKDRENGESRSSAYVYFYEPAALVIKTRERDNNTTCCLSHNLQNNTNKSK